MRKTTHHWVVFLIFAFVIKKLKGGSYPTFNACLLVGNVEMGGVVEMSRTRIVIGTFLSALALFVVLPAVFWVIAEALDQITGLPETPISGPLSLILTGLSWSLGLFWIFWAYSYLVFVGEGSPAEAFGIALEPTKQLVTTGPYAYVRNPMIFGLMFIFLGVGFLANSIMGLALVPVAGLIAAGYISLFEERELAKRFGIVYEHYRDHVPMLIPRPVPYVQPES